ncbi:MAG: CBS domain-containing protein [Thermoplasmata archaeon]|nr:CBS domain-containing protein [Thermoplasmata archaeon]MBE3137445.1 CBS domain-containing protein [Thermoplasmata archaeon]MBE3139896.1 CBS domain-containing protein [Thermoplasmata archaeon]
MLVKEIMIKDVVTIDADASVFDACMMYKEKKVGCLVVIDNETCVGIVTERDLIERSICQHQNPEKTKVREIMSQNIKVVYALDTVEKALETMKQYKIKKLPVISSEKVVGIITITDIAKARPDLSKRFMESWMKAQWRD